MATVTDIVVLLKEASDAYYNGGTLKMDDDTYDSLVERLKELDPKNPYLSEVGAKPHSVAELPFAMPSLDKIKPGEDALQRFLLNTDGFVMSEKLDGLSALWDSRDRKLFLRGNGILGQDISHLVNLGIQGLVRGTEYVRGELIIPRSEGIALSRSWVNGQVHQHTPNTENIKRIRFIAYEMMDTRMKRSAQFEWLKQRGFIVPWYTRSQKVSQSDLSEKLIERRSISEYDTDGIVVGLDRIPVSESTDTRAKNPKDCMAFKMPLADQSAETTVQEVIWAPSAQGYIIPRIRFDPVVIGSATIEFCTGHNARIILQNKIGPGAKIIVRRSGDVIPKFDGVISSAKEASFPPQGTWVWDGETHIKVVGDPEEMTVVKLHYFLKTLEIPGAGPATAVALVKAGVKGPAALWAATPETLCKILGPTNGVTLHTNLRSTFEKASELLLMHASSTMPRGVGDTKLTNLFAAEMDPRKWRGMAAQEGWTTKSFQDFLDVLPTYVAWRQKEIHWIPYPILKAVTVNVPTSEIICMTGFRDKGLEEMAAKKGYTCSPNLTGKVTILLVPDGELKESEKIKQARAKGIKILPRSQFLAQYLT